MWSYSLDLKSIKLTVVKVVISRLVKELIITVYLLKCLIGFWILVTKYLIFLQTICDF